MNYQRMMCVLMITLLTSVAIGQRGLTAPAQDQQLSTLVYDISDMFRTTADYPLPGSSAASSGRGGGGRLFGNETAAQQQVEVATAKRALDEQVGNIVTLIQDTVDASSWKEQGGTIGSIRSLGKNLVITQTTDNHKQIGTLLSQLRVGDGPTKILSVRCTWLEVKEGDLQAGNEPTAEWISKQKVYAQSQLNCFNGQTVHMTSGMSRRVKTDVTPVVATGAVAFDPTIGVELNGVSLQVTPQIVPGHELVIVDLHSSVTEGQKDEPMEATALSNNSGAEAKTVTTIDRSTSLVQEFQTTTRVGLRKKTIIGGMTLNPTDGAGDKRQIYLLIEIDAPK
jgi:hypothetical protein